MKDDADQTRRWIINTGGAAILSNALVATPSPAQDKGAPAGKAPKAEASEDEVKEEPISPVTIALAEYVSTAFDRELPPAVVAKTKLHTLDTIAAMVSGRASRPANWRPAMSTASAASPRRPSSAPVS